MLFYEESHIVLSPWTFQHLGMLAAPSSSCFPSLDGRWKMTWAVEPIVDHRGSSEWRGHRNENPLCRRDFPIQVLKTAQVSRTDYSSVLKNDRLEFLPFSLMIFTPLSQNPWDIVRAFPSLPCFMAEGYCIFQSSDCELTMSIHKIRCFFFKVTDPRCLQMQIQKIRGLSWVVVF